MTTVAALLVASSAGCKSGGGGEAQGATTTPTTTTTTNAPDAGTTGGGGEAQASGAGLPPMPEGLHGPSKPWEQMTPEERGHYMGESVMPAMGELFHAYDASTFASPNCATCHGANAREVGFRMPNTLPALPTPGGPAWQDMMTHQAHMVSFMGERVVPAMAQLLGMQPFNPETRQGFGCFACHPHAP